MAWFIGQSLLIIVIAFLLGLLVGWLWWGRRRPAPLGDAAEPSTAAPPSSTAMPSTRTMIEAPPEPVTPSAVASEPTIPLPGIARARALRRVYPRCVLLAVVPLVVYAYLPLRSAANPPVDWGDPETWSRFWAVVSRQQYAYLWTRYPRTLERFVALVVEFLRGADAI